MAFVALLAALSARPAFRHPSLGPEGVSFVDVSSGAPPPRPTPMPCLCPSPACDSPTARLAPPVAIVRMRSSGRAVRLVQDRERASQGRARAVQEADGDERVLRLPRASVECLLAAPVAQGVAPVGGVAAPAVGEALVTAVGQGVAPASGVAAPAVALASGQGQPTAARGEDLAAAAGGQGLASPAVALASVGVALAPARGQALASFLGRAAAAVALARGQGVAAASGGQALASGCQGEPATPCCQGFAASGGQGLASFLGRAAASVALARDQGVAASAHGQGLASSDVALAGVGVAPAPARGQALASFIGGAAAAVALARGQGIAAASGGQELASGCQGEPATPCYQGFAASAHRQGVASSAITLASCGVAVTSSCGQALAASGVAAASYG